MVQGYTSQPKELTQKFKEDIQRLRLIKEEEKLKRELQALSTTEPAEKKKPKAPGPKHLPGAPAGTAAMAKAAVSGLGGTGGAGGAGGRQPRAKETKADKKLTTEEKERQKKLTWQGLGNISYKDIKGNEDFNPANLLAVEEEDEEYNQIIGHIAHKRASDSISAQSPKGLKDRHHGLKYSNKSSSLVRKRCLLLTIE